MFENHLYILCAAPLPVKHNSTQIITVIVLCFAYYSTLFLILEKNSPKISTFWVKILFYHIKKIM